MAVEQRTSEAVLHTCDICGKTMLSLHCKLVCLNCGYRRDCSDPGPAAPF